MLEKYCNGPALASLIARVENPAIAKGEEFETNFAIAEGNGGLTWGWATRGPAEYYTAGKCLFLSEAGVASREEPKEIPLSALQFALRDWKTADAELPEGCHFGASPSFRVHGLGVPLEALVMTAGGGLEYHPCVFVEDGAIASYSLRPAFTAAERPLFGAVLFAWRPLTERAYWLAEKRAAGRKEAIEKLLLGTPW